MVLLYVYRFVQVENVDLGRDRVESVNAAVLTGLLPAVDTNVSSSIPDSVHQNLEVTSGIADKDNTSSKVDDDSSDINFHAAKRPRTTGDLVNPNVDSELHVLASTEMDVTLEIPAPMTSPASVPKIYTTHRTFEERNASKPKEVPPSRMLVSIPASRIKAHSAFLTFALRPTPGMITAANKSKTTVTGFHLKVGKGDDIGSDNGDDM
jgi:hypothetical protein